MEKEPIPVTAEQFADLMFNQGGLLNPVTRSMVSSMIGGLASVVVFVLSAPQRHGHVDVSHANWWLLVGLGIVIYAATFAALTFWAQRTSSTIVLTVNPEATPADPRGDAR